MTYVLAVLVIFGINLMPAFGPPTWSVLVLFRLHSSLNAVALIGFGALAAAAGRYTLAVVFRRLAGRLSSTRTANLAAARDRLTAGRGRLLAGLGLFALSPLPSAQLFEAAGLLRLRLPPIVGVFFAGRLVSYSIYVAGATAVSHTSLGPLVASSFTSPWGIVAQVVMLAAVVALARIDWIRLLTKHHQPDRSTTGTSADESKR
jgi:hypothetical protein